MKYIFLFFIILPQLTLSQSSNPKIEKELNIIMDDWHRAVAEYDADRYFGYMTESSRFLGTDESERWTKKEFREFSMPHFKKQKTWDFKPYDRKVFVSDDAKYAWFDEVLETWMGPCRGSGILRLVEGKWKIEQYNLAILVPNDKVDSYLDIIAKPRKKPSSGTE